MINPTSIMKIKNAKNRFAQNHPKFVAFLNAVFAKEVEEGTIIEITVKRPGQDAMTANIKVQQTDVELLQEMRELVKTK